MAEPASLDSFKALYADLHALSEQRLTCIERLGAQLDAHMRDFKNLLDKKARNDASRKSLATGKLNAFGSEYSINEEFQRGAQEIASELDLDELDAARIFLEAQVESEVTGLSARTCSLLLFHQRRKYTLDCLRLLCQMSADIGLDERVRESLQALVHQVVEPQTGMQRITQRCLAALGDIKMWLQKLAEKLNSASVVGQLSQEVQEAIEYQRSSLVTQHESLSMILVYMVKENHSNVADLDSVLDIVKMADKYDNILVHYLPVLSACISKYGSTEAYGGIDDARNLHRRLLGQANEKPWTLAYVQAAFRVLWLAEYSGWYGEAHDGSLPENQLEDEANQRAKLFTEALKDGAFDFILSVSADIKSAEWHDPARQGLRQWLQRKSPVLLADSVPFSECFQALLMEQLETFVESFITNLPDVLRKLRIEEDEQRQLSKDHDHDLDLERFIVIISYTFEGRPKASLEGFWDMPDGALMGFLRWASRRASTPLVSAFCEMLQSISEDDECATSAHHFLLDEGSQASGNMKTQSLTWNQIFKELIFFSAKLRDHPTVPQSQNLRHSNTHHRVLEAEPESVMMLECYLRLITRLASESDAVRIFLAHHPSFQLSELLFQLASSSIEPRLRANAFTTLRSLLSHKTRETGEYIWTALDVWISGGYSPGSTMSKTTVTIPSASMESILQGLTSGFEEPNSFVQLLHSLILPYSDDSGLNDSLPFPETLGISTRQPGIDPYVDFVIGRIFSRPAQELDGLEVVQIRLMHLTCLDFIAACLETFNEDLIILGSQAKISIDSAIKVSNLQSYILLHPFSRVMEWMFNEKIMNVLFAAIHQDPAEIARATPDSPLILCILRGIQVITSILELQPTYLNIVRPLLKSQPNYRRTPVPHASFRSFEDGILNHLAILNDLGQYCGTGHPELIIASLKLLEKLSSSPKLSVAPVGLARGCSQNKALAALNDDAEIISTILLREMKADIDVNHGPESPAYIIKLHILEFINACFRASPGQPTIAHLLLGFRCGKEGLYIDQESSFNRGVSLLHTILDLVLDSKIGDDTVVASWLIALNFKAIQVLKELWLSPLSSSITMAEMRANDFFFVMFVKEQLIQPGIIWDGLDVLNPIFFSTSASSCLAEFLGRRAALLQYFSVELKAVSCSHLPSLKQRLFETLMGSTAVEGGQKIENATVFDLFDFMDFELNHHSEVPELAWFSDDEISACLDDFHSPFSTCNLTKLEELLVLRRSELTNAKKLENPQDLAMLNSQAQELIDFFATDNRIKILKMVRLQILKSWVQLILIMIESANFDDTLKAKFVLRALQTIMPRLENDLDVVDETMELARLAKSLLFSLNFGATCFQEGDMAELVSDRLFHLFQISLRAINSLGTKVFLKEWHYNICFRYLVGMSDLVSGPGLYRRHSMQTIKAAGDRFIDVVCDDANNGEATCRISALLVLCCLVKMGKNENSKYIIESLTRLNFIGLMIESVRNIPIELRDATIEDVDMQLSYCHAKLSLLLEISQTRFGAAAVCNAGLFYAIKDSGLFEVDPDLGVEITGPRAVGKYYDLLAAVMRIICALVVSRGPQNQQTLDQGRRFLADNRLAIVGMLKKSGGLAPTKGMSPDTIEDLTESYFLLITYTGFLQTEEYGTQNKPSARVFTSFT